jgi:hypothetical protein
MKQFSPEEFALITALLEPFRQAALPKPHLGGFCMPVSGVAEQILNSRKFQNRTWKAVSGDFTGPTERERGHSWLIGTGSQDTILLDLTADQFGLSVPYYDAWPHAHYEKFEDMSDDAHSYSRGWDGAVAQSLKNHGF